MIATLILYEKEIQTNSFFLYGRNTNGPNTKSRYKQILFSYMAQYMRPNTNGFTEQSQLNWGFVSTQKLKTVQIHYFSVYIMNFHLPEYQIVSILEPN